MLAWRVSHDFGLCFCSTFPNERQTVCEFSNFISNPVNEVLEAQVSPRNSQFSCYHDILIRELLKNYCHLDIISFTRISLNLRYFIVTSGHLRNREVAYFIRFQEIKIFTNQGILQTKNERIR